MSTSTHRRRGRPRSSANFEPFTTADLLQAIERTGVEMIRRTGVVMTASRNNGELPVSFLMEIIALSAALQAQLVAYAGNPAACDKTALGDSLTPPPVIASGCNA